MHRILSLEEEEEEGGGGGKELFLQNPVVLENFQGEKPEDSFQAGQRAPYHRGIYCHAKPFEHNRIHSSLAVPDCESINAFIPDEIVLQMNSSDHHLLLKR
ncbi:hypothetical protein CEXT_478191 [Caerostris extrusa]|uniref:Uncharacterized protein n=1 Tax=Caerostris extrusa TaxID=172846 RepID=A0AAV4XTD6_CAEEX|nr:hypothetical protein CEXT_478191 [Caerostris extrusa]